MEVEVRESGTRLDWARYIDEKLEGKGLKLVERDAVMLAWKGALSLPRLDWSDDHDLARLDRRYIEGTRVPSRTVEGRGYLGRPAAGAVAHAVPSPRASPLRW